MHHAAAVATAVAMAVPLLAAAAERASIEAEITALRARFDAEEAACAGRFLVTPCVVDVRQQRRQTLTPLQAQIHALDDAERRAKAADRLQVIEAKRQLQQQRNTTAAGLPSPAAPASASDRAPLVERSPMVVGPRRGPASAPDAAAAAAQRVEARKRREQQAGADAERVRMRIERRSQQGKPAVPLPVPAASRPSR